MKPSLSRPLQPQSTVPVAGSGEWGNVVAVVGPCASGKTTLVRELRRRRYTVREVAQEHSLVPDLWRRRGRQGPMVFLDVSPKVACRRRGITLVPSWWSEASARLELARREADFYLCTDDLTPQQVADRVGAFLISSNSCGGGASEQFA